MFKAIFTTIAVSFLFVLNSCAVVVGEVKHSSPSDATPRSIVETEFMATLVYLGFTLKKVDKCSGNAIVCSQEAKDLIAKDASKNYRTIQGLVRMEADDCEAYLSSIDDMENDLPPLFFTRSEKNKKLIMEEYENYFDSYLVNTKNVDKESYSCANLVVEHNKGKLDKLTGSKSSMLSDEIRTEFINKECTNFARLMSCQQYYFSSKEDIEDGRYNTVVLGKGTRLNANYNYMKPGPASK